MRSIRGFLPILAALWLTGSLPSVQSPSHVVAPDLLLGTFMDDYGIGYRITDSSWALGSRDRYDIEAWHDSAQFLVARNGSNNTSHPGQWTRIDWVRLEGMPPFEWAFCLIVYSGETAAAAQANNTADHANPRNGCNGFPFSRMRRVPADSVAPSKY